ncbi:hypothetical protein HDV06_005234 [Boothiomyces sp. JEL0866]|nr:hypothetical protein HDV06_005234 [Boothiomyces sp. JEL0866]
MDKLPIELMQTIAINIGYLDYYNLYFTYRIALLLPPVLSIQGFKDMYKTDQYYRLRDRNPKFISLPILDKNDYSLHSFNYLFENRCPESVKMIHLIEDSELKKFQQNMIYSFSLQDSWAVCKYMLEKKIEMDQRFISQIFNKAASENRISVLKDMDNFANWKHKQSALQYVSSSNAFQAFEYLLLYPIIEIKGYSVLYTCACNRDPRFISRLLEVYQDYHIQFYNLRGCFRYFLRKISKQNAEIIFNNVYFKKTLLDSENILEGSGGFQYDFIWDYLLENYGDPSVNRNEAIFVACKENNIYLVDKLIKDQRVNPYDRNCSIFELLLSRKQLKIFMKLYKKGLDFDFKSILLECIKRNNKNLIKFLLDNQAIRISDFKEIHVREMLKKRPGNLLDHLLQSNLYPLIEHVILHLHDSNSLYLSFFMNTHQLRILIPKLDHRFAGVCKWFVNSGLATEKKLVTMIKKRFKLD